LQTHFYLFGKYFNSQSLPEFVACSFRFQVFQHIFQHCKNTIPKGFAELFKKDSYNFSGDSYEKLQALIFVFKKAPLDITVSS